MRGDDSQPDGNRERISVSPAADQSGRTPPLPPCKDFDIRIARDGTWFYRGSPIRRTELVRLFSTVLRQEDDGSYWLVTPVERGRVTVEDAPFTAVELTVDGGGTRQVLRFRTNVGDWVAAGPDHPLHVALDPSSGAPRPYILVRDRLEALIVRSVYYHLAELAVERRHEGADSLGVWSNETFFPLGRAA